jgi:chromosome segregation ATPase
MACFRGALFLGLCMGAAATFGQVTPIEKVIELIKGMKDEVESDGKTEAKAYDEFACFCKDTTGAKSKSIIKGKDEIDLLSADIADKTQEKKDDTNELGERKVKQEELAADLEATNVRCAKEKAEYEAEAADLSKAIQGLKDAIKAMSDSKPASFLALRATLSKVLAMADVMNEAFSSKHKAVLELLQRDRVDPSDPEYKFHSQDIIDLCEKLLGEYKDTKKDLDDEYEKTSKACDEMKKSLRKKMKANKKAMEALDKNIQKLAKEIAEHREDLVLADQQLKDDELYLKDLTARCEARAHDYDQRSAMRNDELSALVQALEVLSKDVKGRADDVNERALFLQSHNSSAVAKVAAPVAKPAAVAVTKAAKPVLKAVSLLQEVSENSGFMAKRTGLTLEARRNSALTVLKQEGQRIGSMALMSLSARAAADPFKKVKGLIQKLIERLLEESAAEATKKGFCDEELGKAESDRDYRFTEANDLSAELEKLEAKKDELEAEIEVLTKDIKEETKALKETTKDRKDEKEANMKTIKTAKEGFEAVNEALLILKSFYKQAAKASFVQASPVDEDTSGPGFDGNYKGKQGGAKAIFALLETISSDFDRTLRTTEEEEHAAHREFIDYEQTAKSSIAGKTTKKELDEQDLKTTKTDIKTKMADMQTAVDLLDKALEELEELKPTCMDSGMSYKERVEKREEEMKALGKALCILDEEGVEPDCKGGLM